MMRATRTVSLARWLQLASLAWVTHQLIYQFSIAGSPPPNDPLGTCSGQTDEPARVTGSSSNRGWPCDPPRERDGFSLFPTGVETGLVRLETPAQGYSTHIRPPGTRTPDPGRGRDDHSCGWLCLVTFVNKVACPLFFPIEMSWSARISTDPVSWRFVRQPTDFAHV